MRVRGTGIVEGERGEGESVAQKEILVVVIVVVVFNFTDPHYIV